jgi:CubicO group peptidase (beta-lactamase class C family)
VHAVRVAFAIAFAIAAAGCRSEGKADARAQAEDAGADAKARAVLARAAVAGIGFAAVTRDKDVVVGGVGTGDLARRSGVTGETVFEAASIAKLVVATCVMQLVEEGKLDLDADASKYVGLSLRHPRSQTPITLRMLLSHRASIRDRREEIAVARAGHELAAFLAQYMVEEAKPRAAAFLDAAPGTATAYSNVGASLAALAVERVAGATFAEVSAHRVLEPLRMRDTSWVAPLRTSTNGARPYAHVDGGFVSLPSPSHALYPSVDLHASARDLARFARVMLRDGELDGARILTPTSVHAMMSAVAGDGEQALAWQLRTIGPTRVAGHEGEDAGATTALFLDLASGTGAVVLANGDAFASEDPARAAAVQGFLGDLLGIAAR